jgi:hypothetical protein
VASGSKEVKVKVKYRYFSQATLGFTQPKRDDTARRVLDMTACREGKPSYMYSTLQKQQKIFRRKQTSKVGTYFLRQVLSLLSRIYIVDEASPVMTPG